ncbi:hypothetical protein, partial [Acetobacter lambici]
DHGDEEARPGAACSGQPRRVAFRGGWCAGFQSVGAGRVSLQTTRYREGDAKQETYRKLYVMVAMEDRS